MDPLDLFQPSVAVWFRERYGEPTPPQAQGWPAISRGEHVLILAPTGSGKTLAAFMWGIDRIYRSAASGDLRGGVQLLYISPLKALNNDIERNLREPLAGIRSTAARLGTPLPPLSVAVRTGDTPTAARQRQLRNPPHILITTPESLYLLLTSPAASAMLDSVRMVIIDEIHTLCGNKRGVHLQVSLERLVERAGAVQRIGLSATQRPLSEVARFLGGQDWFGDELLPRPVTIIDTGVRKPLDLQLVTPVTDLRRLPGHTIWPSLVPHVLDQVRRHSSTLIFTNSRRGAERTADRLNEQFAQEQSEELEPGSPFALIRDGVTIGGWMFGTGRTGGPFHAHHGSVSKELRLELEQKLKAGELAALVGTSSLELGIDIGAVDAALQIQSPHSIARGLQRIGRAGHQVGQTSYGRIYATFREDLLDAAAVAHGMLNGDIEPTYTPRNCLDILAQQVVAIVACQEMTIAALYRLLRRAYSYQELTLEALMATLEMLCGKYPSETFKHLRPRLSWDRSTNIIRPLPGSRLLAIQNGGTIADRGEFLVYLPDGKTSLGSLDEEFVNETRAGDIISLGTNTWRVTEVTEDKVVVTESAGSMPRMPFWNGEAPKRDYHLGVRLGELRQQLAERVRDLPHLPDSLEEVWPAEADEVISWLQRDYAMDLNSARNAVHYVRHQLDAIGAISSHQTIIVEVFNDAIGDQRMVIHSCFGSRVNSAWAIALVQALEERWKVRPEVGVNDDGILLRFVDADREPPVDLIREMKADEVRERLLLDLPNSALFGTQFRVNAQRALLLPRSSGNKRTPFWLQRLRAKDLLAAARAYPDFPILVETYRDCLRDVLDIEHLAEVLQGIETGRIRIFEAHSVVPSPVASGILYDFNMDGVYVDDLPKVERQAQALAVDRELLAQLLEEGTLPDLLRLEALAVVEAELQHTAEGYRARDMEELAILLQEMGDLSETEIQERTRPGGKDWLSALAAAGRAFPAILGADMETRWIDIEHYSQYRDAFGLPVIALPTALGNVNVSQENARRIILQRWSRHHGPFDITQLTHRYGFPEAWTLAELRDLTSSGQLVYGRLLPGVSQPAWCDRAVLERIHRRSLSLLRSEVKPVSTSVWIDFRLRWQALHPLHRYHHEHDLVRVLQQLRTCPVPASVWERDILPLRLERYHPDELDDLVNDGDVLWSLSGGDINRALMTLRFRGDDALFGNAGTEMPGLSIPASAVRDDLQRHGASYTEDILARTGLPPREFERAVIELALAGALTNDRMRSLRLLLSGETASPASAGLQSSLAADLATWRSAQIRPAGQRPPPSRLREAQRHAGDKVSRISRWTGRWALLPAITASLSAEQLYAVAQLLLQRHGVLTRECLENEVLACSWAELYAVLQTMELRGQLRRGYFVRGLSGAQFAINEAVELLRNCSRGEIKDSEQLALVNSCDPCLMPVAAAHPEGIPLPARLPGNYVVFQHGQVVLSYEDGGERWRAAEQSECAISQAVRLMRDHLCRTGGLRSQPRRVRVRSWNDAPPLGQPVQPLLESLGFRRDTPGMVWEDR